MDKKLDELVEDIIALGTDHANGAFPDGRKPNGTFAPQNEEEAKTALKQLISEAEIKARASFDELADGLVEKKNQLRVEHNHSDMKWYAYYAGKSQRQLFDDEIDWETGSATPSEAVTALIGLVATGRIATNGATNPPNSALKQGKGE